MSATVRILVGSYAKTAARNVIDNGLLENVDLDRAVECLSLDGGLTDMERQVLAVASVGHSKTSGSKKLGLSRRDYSLLLNSACRKIAKFLGWEYSDSRTVLVVRAKMGRELTEKETKTLKYFLSRYSANYSDGAVLSETNK